MSKKDTIAAIATPHGVGGIGVIRLSGSKAKDIAEKITQKPLKINDIQFCSFKNRQNEVIDHGIVLYFKSPYSFTGEDVVELQGHGGMVIQDMLLQQVIYFGARIAKPGEFSERAFLNNKIDLTQAEAIADLIESNSEAAAKAAMRSLQGEFSKQISHITEQIINLRCYIEAALDFSEEEIDFLAESNIETKLQQLQDSIQVVINNAQNGAVLKEGLTLVIMGQPNAGKSSLLNTLTGYDTAIVTPVAGTTRDIISEQIVLNDIPIKVEDTAGLRETNDLIEQEGIKKAWNAVEKADVALLLIDSTKGIEQQDKKIIDRLTEFHTKFKIIYTKIDLIEHEKINKLDDLAISTISNQGINDLVNWITQDQSHNNESQTILARRRHLDALDRAQDAVKKAKETFLLSQSGELMAEDLREAQKDLNEITGEFNTEDLLGKIFSSFCIGK